MRKISIQLLFLLYFIWVPMAWPGDSTDEPLQPKLTLESGECLHIEGLDLNINQEKITLNYTIYNDSDHDWQGQLAVVVQPHYSPGFEAWYPDRSFRELDVLVNSSLQAYQRHSKAYFNGVDITSLLKVYGLNIELADTDWLDFVPVPASLINISKYLPLEKSGIISLDFEAESNGQKIMTISPNWSSAYNYNWPQSIAAHSRATISYAYFTKPGFDQISIGEKGSGSLFLQQSGYQSLDDLMSQVCLCWDDIANMMPTSYKYYNFYWLSIPVIEQAGIKPFKNIKINLTWGESGKVESAKNYGLAVCLDGQAYHQIGKINAELSNVSLGGKIVMLIIMPYPS